MSDQLEESDLADKYHAHQHPTANPRTRIISYVPSNGLSQNGPGFGKTPVGLAEMINPCEVDQDGLPIGMGTVIMNGMHHPVRKIKWKKTDSKIPPMSFVFMNFEVLKLLCMIQFIYLANYSKLSHTGSGRFCGSDKIE
jgi:hypothetical protein